MAKVKVKGPKTGLQKLNRVLFIILAILLVATVLIVAFSSAKGTIIEKGETEFVDEPKIEAFVANTYGGVEFKTQDDVVNYYVECYNNTKTMTADYTYEGEPKKMYKLVGDENIKIENLLVEGKANATIDKLVPTILDSLFKGGVKSLSPGNSLEPQYDNQDGKYDRTVSHLTPEDVLAANVTDNGDGTITLRIQPKAQLLAMPGEDSQGRFFNVLGDISGTVEQISVLSFSEGTIDENFVVNYAGGVGEIKINVANKEVVEADYVMNVHIDVKHANVTVIKNKNASLDIVYSNHFPASDQYLTDHNMARK